MRGPGAVPGAALGSGFFLFLTATPRHSTTYGDSQIDHRQIDQSWLFLVKLIACSRSDLFSTWRPAPWNALFTSFGDFPAWIPLMWIVLVGIMIFFMFVFFKSSFQNLVEEFLKNQIFPQNSYLLYFLNCSPLKSLVMSSAGRFASYGILTRSNLLKVTTNVSPFRVVPSRWSLVEM